MSLAPRKPLFSSNYQLDILICLGLVLAVFIPYHQVAGHRFVEFDDGMYTFYNTRMMEGLSWNSICWAFTNTDVANWHPLTWLSHLIDRELFTSHPGGYLLENVAWHALASCLCYCVFLKTTGRRFFALWVALIFAVHPVNVENVAWTSERKSLLNAVFWFWAILAYIDFIETRSIKAYGVTTIAFLLSLLAKAMSVTLPCTLVLIHLLYIVYHPGRHTALRRLPLDIWKDDEAEPGSSPTSPAGPCSRLILGILPSRISGKLASGRVWQCFGEFLLPVIPLLIISVYFSAVTVSAQVLAIDNAGCTSSQKLINAIISYWDYICMFFHPNQLALFYPLFPDELTFDRAFPAILGLVAISVGALVLVRRKPQFLIGWFWFLGTLTPVIGLVQIGSQSHADRYLYIPMLGLAFVFPVLFEELRSISGRARNLKAGTSVVLLGISMAAATQIQVSYWKDGVTLFKHSLAVTGDCLTPVIDLSCAYGRNGRYPEAIAFIDSKLPKVKNPRTRGRLDALKASCLYNIGKYSTAAEAAQEAVSLGSTEGSAYWILAFSDYSLGRFEEAARFTEMTEAAR